MAYWRTVAHRFREVAKSYSGQIRCGTSAVSQAARGSIFRRLLPDTNNRGIQWRPIVKEAVPPDRISMPIGLKLFDRRDRPNFDHLCRDMLAPPPFMSPIHLNGEEEERATVRMTEKDASTVLKASQMDLVKSRLRAIPNNTVCLSDFLRICHEVSSAEEGPELALSLEESAAVIVIGNVVFVRPEEVAKAIETAIPLCHSSLHDERKEELMKLEHQKAMIDKLAKAKARRELWFGLAFFAAQTASFMRLTFWELSWDVMEPICFYVTSTYFLAGYVFFLRTSTEPSFEGFFNRRFATKQKQLMKAFNFDLCRFNQLKGGCGAPLLQLPSSSCGDCNRTDALFGPAL